MGVTQTDLLAGFGGGVVGGALVLPFVVLAGGDATLDSLVTIYGLNGIGNGVEWGLFLVHTGTIGLMYGVFMGVGTNWYIRKLLMLTRQHPPVARAMMPLINRVGIAVVVSALTGSQVGLVIWVVGPVIVLPGLTDGSIPQIEVSMLVLALVYGTIMGAFYGKWIEQ